MKKRIIIIYLLFLHGYICMAQQQEDNSSKKVEDVKVEYMTKELNLTPEESQKFWPVYNNYYAEIKLARKNYINDEVAFEEKVVEIRKRYKDDFRKVLNGEARANRVFVSEKKLRDLFKKELQNRQKLRRPLNRQQKLPRQKS
ncbi:MAG TPA: hypothetical protein PLP23_03050 [Panacibacter sp.]|nr:hypothetical protein [Panacibacter sp.]